MCILKKRHTRTPYNICKWYLNEARAQERERDKKTDQIGDTAWNVSVDLEANRGDDIEIQPTDSMLIEMESSRSQHNYSFFIHNNSLRISAARNSSKTDPNAKTKKTY